MSIFHFRIVACKCLRVYAVWIQSIYFKGIVIKIFNSAFCNIVVSFNRKWKKISACISLACNIFYLATVPCNTMRPQLYFFCSALAPSEDTYLWFILRGDLLYVFPCVILFLCFSVLLVLRIPRLGKRELILVLFVRLFGLCLFRFVGFLFLLGSGKGCGLWLWHSLDFSLTFFKGFVISTYHTHSIL